MSNKVLKQRENQGWRQLRRQLDIDMPLDKKKDKKLLWLFLAAGLGLSGIIWFNTSQRSHPALLEEKPQVNKPAQEMAGIRTPGTAQNPPVEATQTPANLPDPTFHRSQNAITTTQNLSQDALKTTHATGTSRSDALKYKRDAGAQQTSNEVTDLLLQNSTPARKDDLALIQEKPSEDLKNSNPVESPAIAVVSNQPDINPMEDARGISAESKSSQNQVSKAPENSDVTSKSSGETVVELQPVSAQETPIPVVQSRSGHHHNNLNAAIEYTSDKFFSSYLMAGRQWPVGGKLYFAGQAGLGFQFNKSNFKVIGSNALSSNGPGKNNNDINNSSVFTSVQANKILLDQSRVISGFRGDTLVLSANDEIDFQSRNQWMAAVQAGIGYRISPHWSVESGLHFKSYITASKELLRVNYAMAANNGFNTSNSSIYQLKASTLRSQWSWYIQTSVPVTQRWGLNLQFNTSPFILTTRKAELANAVTGAGQASATGRSLSLPIKQDASSLKFSIQYKF